MKMLPAFAAGLVAFVIGVFCCSQILGTIQDIKTRGTGVSILAVSMWILVLAASYFLFRRFLPTYTNDYLIGLVLAFVMTLKPGKTR